MPVVIGSQTDVPNVGDPIVSPWYQDTARKIVHVFASTAARDAWVGPPDGAVCQAPAGTWWNRVAGVWVSPNSAAWSTFIPTLIAPTPPNLGTGSTQSGRSKVVNAICDVRIFIAWGSTGATTGAGTFTIGGLPTPFGGGVEGYGVVGFGHLLLGNGGPRTRNNVVALRNAAAPSEVQVYCPELWSSSVPAAPTFGDSIKLVLRYEIT